MNKKKEIDQRLQQARKSKQTRSASLDRKLGKQKNNAKFSKVNFNG